MSGNFRSVKAANMGNAGLRCLVVMFSFLSWMQIAAAEVDPLDEGVSRLATAISAFFEKQKLTRTTTVSGVVDQDSGSDAAIYEKLLAELRNASNKFTIARSEVIINVRKVHDQLPTPADPNGDQQIALKLTAEIRQRRSDVVIANISIPIFGRSALLHLNPTVALSTSLNVSEKQRQQEFVNALDNPSTTFLNNQVLPKVASPFGVEIRVVKERKKVNGASVVSRSESCQPADVDGLAFVTLKKGDEYLVRLYNRENFEVACGLIIDGLSMFAFSQEVEADSKVIIPPGGSIDVPGWYVTSELTDAFEIGQYAKSAAAAKEIPMTRTGTITVSFHACWEPQKSPPPDEAIGKSADNATIRGRRIEQQYKVVPRVIGRERAFVTVRYNR